MPDYRVCQLCEVRFDDPSQLNNQYNTSTPPSTTNNTSSDPSNKDLLIFFCGHTYHNSCVKDFITPLLCPICIENPLNTCMQISLESFFYCLVNIERLILCLKTVNMNTINGNKTFTKTGKRIPRKLSTSQDDPFAVLDV